MNGLSSIGFDTFVRSSMFLAAAAVAMAIALRLLRPKSPIAHRLAWASVLVCGVLVLHISLEIPWYDPPATSSAAVAEALPALPAGRTLAAEAEPGNGPAPTVIEPRRQIGWRTVFASVWVIGMAIAVSLSAFSYACLLLSVRRATAAPHGWRGRSSLLKNVRPSCVTSWLTSNGAMSGHPWRRGRSRCRIGSIRAHGGPCENSKRAASGRATRSCCRIPTRFLRSREPCWR